MTENSENKKQAAANLRVLLVDDQDDLLQVMNILLQRRRGYEVETAQSGDQAMQKAPDFAPHVVVSDITMPGRDGCELMRNLRSLEGGELSPFRSIALSGYDTSNDPQLTQCGYDAHLTKPVDFDQLLNMIDELATDVRKPTTK
jgi:CheY-like chemotaxis protein